MTPPQTHTILAHDNAPLIVYEWTSTNPDATPVLFLHATGFHGHCWDAIMRELPDYHCYALDARGHGQSQQPTAPIAWHQAGQDVVAVVEALGLENAIGVGHSMGGNSLVRAASHLPQAFRKLILVDPVIFPPSFYNQDTYSIAEHFILNRRREWTSVQEMMDSFRGRGPFAKWQEEILRDYCVYGLLPDENGYHLACAPETEAHIYSSGTLRINADIYDAIAKIEVPVTILRCAQWTPDAGQNLILSPTNPNLAIHFKNAIDIPLTENTHFIPMESPELIVEDVRAV